MQIYIMPDLVNFTLQILSTLVLFLVIKRFAWAPMKEFLRKRQELVSQEINHAEMLKADAPPIPNKSAIATQDIDKGNEIFVAALPNSPTL